MTAAVAVAPASSAAPGLAPTTTLAGCPEPIIIACALAGSDHQISNLWMFPDRVHAIVDHAVADHDLAHILSWRERVQPELWAARWQIACRLVAEIAPYRKLPGADALPDFYAMDFPSLAGT